MSAPLDQTVTALEGGLTSLTPSAAASNIDSWIETLGGTESLGTIRDGLQDLKTALTSTPLDGARIGALLTQLGAQTSSAAQTADPSASAQVGRLGSLLTKAGQSLTSGTASRA